MAQTSACDVTTRDGTRLGAVGHATRSTLFDVLRAAITSPPTDANRLRPLQSETMSDTSQKLSVSQCILRSYYPTVMTLQNYLSEILQSGRRAGNFLTHETDTMSFRVLLQNGIVCSQSDALPQPMTFVPPMVALSEVCN